MTGIEWTDRTWNPVVGCSKVSPGCGLPLPGRDDEPHGGCYAIGVAHRGLQPAHEGLTIRRPGERPDWTGAVRCLPDRLTQPLAWRRPARVFVNSMSDLFHPDVPRDFVAQVFAVMAQADQHTFQVLTKRPQAMATMLAERVAFRSSMCWAGNSHSPTHVPGVDGGHLYHHTDWPLPNVWLGTSIETDRYTFRADHLRATPAAVRFLSCEPLLEPLPSLDLAGIDWVIAGGESGPVARPMHPDWVRDLRDRCATAGLPFFFKQWGTWAPDQPGMDSAGYQDVGPSGETVGLGAYPGIVRMRRAGTKAASRLLDGRTWDQTPHLPATAGPATPVKVGR